MTDMAATRSTWMRPVPLACLAMLACLAQGVSAQVQVARVNTDPLANLSIEELSEIEITSVSRRAERLADAAASVFVITGEAIRRSGARSLPEALRLAPNLQVARVNTGTYAISARGFNNAIGNKLLVLIDGRTVYTPQFSGVNWDAQHVMLEDVERIEVISGPGATLWGANAVNGVINVITRSAAASQGWFVAGGAGNQDDLVASRYGGRLGDNGSYRVYGLNSRRQNTKTESRAVNADGRNDGQLGFRADWEGLGRAFRLQGDAYEGRTDPGARGPVKTAGANLLGRWEQQLGGGSHFHLQAYYDQAERDDPLSLRDETQVFDLEAQHGFEAGAHRVLWGGGYRHARDFTRAYGNVLNQTIATYIFFVPADRSLQWSNLFAQDEISLSDTLTATLGLKAETNVYTGLEWLPSARLAWKPAPDELWWTSISRAVRAPARLDRDFRLNLVIGATTVPVISGGPAFRSEVARVLEVGYRAQPSSRLSYSATLFTSFYDRLRSGQSPPGALVQNMLSGRNRGIEAWGYYQVTPSWRLSAGMLQLRQKIWKDPASLDPVGSRALGNDPKHQTMMRSMYNLSEKMDLDLAIRRVGKLPNPVVPAYTAVDLRLAWRPRPGLEASLVVDNLLDDQHVEFQGDPADIPRQIERSIFLKLQWRE